MKDDTLDIIANTLTHVQKLDEAMGAILKER